MMGPRISAYRAGGAGHDAGLSAAALVLYCLADRLVWPSVQPSGLELLVVDEHSPVAEIQECLTVNERAFDQDTRAATPEAAVGFRPQLSGCVAVVARRAGTAVAGGMRLPVRHRVTELVGIGTLATHRRRGYGAAVTAALAEDGFAKGADLVFLSTADETVRSVYELVGFVPVTGLAGSAWR